MGIPRLKRCLRPYAVEIPFQNTEVVIDGPALAYHIHSLCRFGQRCIPSCELLSCTVIRWLDELASRGNASIEAIYFDGFLPPEKQGIRMGRAEKNTSIIKAFNDMNTRGCLVSVLEPNNKEPSLFSMDAMASSIPDTELPYNPLTIPTVLDSLRSSVKYRGVTRLIPGEADSFCAKIARQKPVTILTNDSDLLAHEIGESSVVFLNDIWRSHDTSHMLICLKYPVRQISQRLRLPPQQGLCRLAYEVQSAVSPSLPALLEACRLERENLKYAQFSKPYRTNPSWDSFQSSKNLALHCQNIDPRVSEFVLQCTPHIEQDPTLTSSAAGPRIYLPHVIESFAQRSAFEASTPIRQIAYSLMGSINPGAISYVREFRRVYSASAPGTIIPLLSAVELQSAVTRLADSINHILSSIEREDLFWLRITVQMETESSRTPQGDSLTLNLLRESAFLPQEKTNNRVSWNLVHFKAQEVACRYSFRILSQVSGLFYHSQHLGVSDDVITLLHTIASKTSQFTSPSGLRETVKNLRGLHDSNFPPNMIQLLDVPEYSENPEGVMGDKKSFETENEVGDLRATASMCSRLSNNRFSVLNID